MNANITKETRKAVYRRDGYRCALCDGTSGLQIHHIVKRSCGGTSFPHNLIALCWKCHAAAHGTKIEEYPEYITEEYIAQACVEYISDLYAEQGLLWQPWAKQLERLE